MEFDPGTDRLTVYGATKVPHWNLRTTAELLGIPPSRLRMRETAVGGGFGVRGELYPEDVLAVWAADRLRRSVSWIEDRREHLLAANHSRQQRHRARIAGYRDGRIAAIASALDMDTGAYIRTHSIRVADLTLSMIPGPYDWRPIGGPPAVWSPTRPPPEPTGHRDGSSRATSGSAWWTCSLLRSGWTR